jgi:hypothetical protein
MSFLTPRLTERAPDLARFVPWFLVLSALIILATVTAGVLLMRFRARLTVAEARRIATTTSFREIHRNMVRAKRLVTEAILIVAAGVLVAWTAGVLTPELIEFFLVAGTAGFGSAYFGVAVLEAVFRRVADRFDDLLKGSPS